MSKKDILLLLGSGFILVVAWIAFNIYHNLATSTVAPTVGNHLRPIPPVFDTESITKLKQRKKVSLDFKALDSQQATTSSQLIPTPTIPIATASGEVATEGASIP